MFVFTLVLNRSLISNWKRNWRLLKVLSKGGPMFSKRHGFACAAIYVWYLWSHISWLQWCTVGNICNINLIVRDYCTTASKPLIRHSLYMSYLRLYSNLLQKYYSLGDTCVYLYQLSFHQDTRLLLSRSWYTTGINIYISQVTTVCRSASIFSTFI